LKRVIDCDKVRIKYHFELEFDSKLWIDRPLMEKAKAEALTALALAEQEINKLKGIALTIGCDVEFVKDGVVDQGIYDMSIGNRSRGGTRGEAARQAGS